MVTLSTGDTEENDVYLFIDGQLQGQIPGKLIVHTLAGQTSPDSAQTHLSFILYQVIP